MGFDADLTKVLMVVSSPRNGEWFAEKWEEKVAVVQRVLCAEAVMCAEATRFK